MTLAHDVILYKTKKKTAAPHLPVLENIHSAKLERQAKFYGRTQS